MPNLRDIADEQYRQKMAREYSHIPQEQIYNPIGDALIQVGRNVKERIGALGRSATTLGDLASWQQAGRNLGDVNNMLTADPTLAMDAISPVGLVGMMAGRGAKTANLAMLAKAEEMAKAGIPDSQIWKETGWALDTPDKLPRFEIPDNAAMYRGSKAAGSSYAEDVIQHPELYQQYPSAGGIRINEVGDNIGGNYSNVGREEITLGNRDASSTALHELQHAIQQREGFARGGSPMEFRSSPIETPEYADWSKKMLDDALNWPNVQFKEPKPEKLYIPADEAYQRLAGEAEARLTQARMNLTPEERLAQYPYDPEYFQGATGVNLKDLIVRKDGGTAMSIPERNIPELMTDAEKAMLQYELSKIPKKPALSLRDLAIGGGALGAGGLAGYYGIGAME